MASPDSRSKIFTHLGRRETLTIFSWGKIVAGPFFVKVFLPEVAFFLALTPIADWPPMNSKAKSSSPNSLDKFKKIVLAANDGIVTLDSGGNFTFANHTAEKILGVSIAQIRNRSIEDDRWQLKTVRGAPLSREDNPFFRTLEGQKGVFGFKIRIDRPNGEQVALVMNTSPLFSDAGKFEGMVAIFSDITEEFNLQEQNNAFLHTVAHDLRVPLSVVQGYAEVLNESLQKASVYGGVQQSLKEILKATDKMNNMIEDLVDNARIESGIVKLDKKIVSLGEFIWSILESSCTSIDIKRVITRVPQGLPSVCVDSDRLERVFFNLIGNALKFSPAGSQVSLTVKETKDEIRISVSDKGRGISTGDCSRIFKRFFQVQSSAEQKGVGLGLYISRLLVEAHGGRIWVESKEGEGSTFSFTLPLERNECVPPSDQ